MNVNNNNGGIRYGGYQWLYEYYQQESDLSFLKDQITKTEVNIARIHNGNLKLVQEKKVKAPAVQ